MAKAVVNKEDADRIAVAYTPRKFPAAISAAAQEFVAFRAGNSDAENQAFRIDSIVAQQTGVAELERLSIEEKVEREALARLKEFQESAYKEAYELGLDEGREKAFQEKAEELNGQVRHLEELLMSIDRLKADLLACNEKQIVHLAYYMAKRLVFGEIAARPEIVLETIRQALAGAQSDENVRIRVSNADFAFIGTLKEKLEVEFDNASRLKFEADNEVTTGGCVIETNFGDVNATLEQRVERMWIALSEKFPRTSDIMSANPEDSAAEPGDTSGTPGEGE